MATGVLVVGVEKATRLLGYLALTAEGVRRDDPARPERPTTDDADGRVTGHVPVLEYRSYLELQPRRRGADRRDQPDPAGDQRDQGRRPAGLQACPGGRGAGAGRADGHGAASSPWTRCARPATCSDVDVRVTCSSGTYIRALARDLGAALGVGGHLTALRRTARRALPGLSHGTHAGRSWPAGCELTVSRWPRPPRPRSRRRELTADEARALGTRGQAGRRRAPATGRSRRSRRMARWSRC